MIAYVRAHWRGELSLARSFWVNLVALYALSAVAAAWLQQPLSNLSLQSAAKAAMVGLSILILFCVLTVWQFVGAWRSATNTAIRTGRSFWPMAAKAIVGVGFVLAAADTATATRDVAAYLVALRGPELNAYVLERRGESELSLTGAITERSVADIIEALQDPSIRLLRVNSLGGLVVPAIRLSHYIREAEIMVVAEGECISACILLLAASPHAGIYPGTTVSFHRFGPLAEFMNPTVRAQVQQDLGELQNIYRELGISDWAIRMAERQEFWAPTINQQMAMGLIVAIFDPEQERFLPAHEYCAHHRAECSTSIAADDLARASQTRPAEHD